MKFLIKDLSRMTNFSPARIRKWQERYRVFEPTQGNNGYWYYTNDDYRVLRALQQRLASGEKLQQVMALGRQALLQTPIDEDLTEAQWSMIQLVKDRRFSSARAMLEKERKQLLYGQWIRRVVQPACVTVGLAWEKNLLTVSEEHEFSRWLMAYLLESQETRASEEEATWLVASMPGDEHELGALMHFCLLRSRGRSARFVGMLPEDELLKDLRDRAYHTVSISVVMPVTQKKLDSLRKSMQQVAPMTRLLFGGYGLKEARLKARQKVAGLAEEKVG